MYSLAQNHDFGQVTGYVSMELIHFFFKGEGGGGGGAVLT